MDYLDGMTDRQKEAILADGVCTLITAGAGAGKTAVLTRKAYHRLLPYRDQAMKYPPIVAITFTRDAAKEMHSRIKQIAGSQLSQKVIATTFHQFAIRWVIKPYFHLPFFKKQGLSRFKIASNRDLYFNLSQASDQALSDTQKRDMADTDKALEINEWLSLVRAYGHTHQSYFDTNKATFSSEVESLSDATALQSVPTSLDDKHRINFYYLKIWVAYTQLQRTDSLVDLDEILVLATTLLETDQSVRVELKRRFQHLFVDEFQDTNHCQFRFVMALAHDGKGLALFGDIKQAIYGFRGSDPSLFAKVPTRFKNHHSINLPDNFRSVEQVVHVGNLLAQHMSLSSGQPNSLPNENMIARNEGAPLEQVRYKAFKTSTDEVDWIATKIQWLHNEGISYPSIGILYRYRKLADDLENALISRRIPCRRVGGREDKSLYDDPRIFDIVMFLHLIFNPSSRNAMGLFMSTHNQFGLGMREYNQLATQHRFAHNHHAGLSYLLSHYFPSHHLGCAVLSRLTDSILTLSAKLERIKTFEDHCRSRDIHFEGLPAGKKVKVQEQYGAEYGERVSAFTSELREQYCAYFYLPFASDQLRQRNLSREKERIQDDFDAIFSYIRNPDRLISNEINVLEYLCSRPLCPPFIQRKQETNETDVELMTIHASKGLEKEAIFILGNSEEQWLAYTQYTDEDSLTYQEELRLLYVAVTRAKRQLYLTRHVYHYVRNKLYETHPLPFLQYFQESESVSIEEFIESEEEKVLNHG